MTFTFPVVISLIPLGISIILIVLGLYLWSRAQVLGGLTTVIGIVFAIVFGPMLFNDRVVINEKRLEQTTGFWFSPTVKGFDLLDLRKVIITTGRDLKGREIEIWVAEYNDGESVRIDPGDLWESNGDQIVDFLKTLEVPVELTE